MAASERRWTTSAETGGSPRTAASRMLYALLRLDGDRAIVQASNDPRLAQRSVPWRGDLSRVPAQTLQALNFELAVHKTFEAHGERFVLVYGSRGDDPLVVSETIPEWALGLIAQLVQHRVARNGRDVPSVEHALVAEPIVDVRTREPVRAQLMSYDGKAARLADALEQIAAWRTEKRFEAAHVALRRDDFDVLRTHVERIADSAPDVRQALALELDARRVVEPDAAPLLDALRRLGVRVGVCGDDMTLRDVVRLSAQPIAFVKFSAGSDALRLTGGLPWEIFVTDRAQPPLWQALDRQNVRYVQGPGVAPPIAAHEFPRWREAFVPQTTAV